MLIVYIFAVLFYRVFHLYSTSDKFYDLIVNVDILTNGREIRNQRVRKPREPKIGKKFGWLLVNRVRVKP